MNNLPNGLTDRQLAVMNHIDSVKNKAIKNPGKVYKAYAGFYYISVNSTVWIIDHNTELSGNEHWIAYEDNNSGDAMYTDPYATKRELLESLRGYYIRE